MVLCRFALTRSDVIFKKTKKQTASSSFSSSTTFLIANGKQTWKRHRLQFIRHKKQNIRHNVNGYANAITPLLLAYRLHICWGCDVSIVARFECANKTLLHSHFSVVSPFLWHRSMRFGTHRKSSTNHRNNSTGPLSAHFNIRMWNSRAN